MSVVHVITILLTTVYKIVLEFGVELQKKTTVEFVAVLMIVTVVMTL